MKKSAVILLIIICFAAFTSCSVDYSKSWKCNGKYFETLDEAVAYASSLTSMSGENPVVTLLKNTQEESATVNTSLTIKLGRNAYTVDTLTIGEGVPKGDDDIDVDITSDGGSAYIDELYVSEDLKISGNVNFNASSTEVESGASLTVNTDSSNPVYLGAVTGAGSISASEDSKVYAESTTGVEITGGTVTSDVTVKITKPDGSFTMYQNFVAALTYTNVGNGDSLCLLQDVTYTGCSLGNMSVSFDFYGHKMTLSGNVILNAGGTLKLIDSSKSCGNDCLVSSTKTSLEPDYKIVVSGGTLVDEIGIDSSMISSPTE